MFKPNFSKIYNSVTNSDIFATLLVSKHTGKHLTSLTTAESSLTQASLYEWLRRYMKFGSWKTNGLTDRGDRQSEWHVITSSVSDGNDQDCLDDEFDLISHKHLLQTHLSPKKHLHSTIKSEDTQRCLEDSRAWPNEIKARSSRPTWKNCSLWLRNVHCWNATQYYSTETVLLIFPFIQTNITVQMRPSGG